jgi:hypothetical protein
MSRAVGAIDFRGWRAQAPIREHCDDVAGDSLWAARWMLARANRALHPTAPDAISERPRVSADRWQLHQEGHQ